jgi:hypothetical protein
MTKSIRMLTIEDSNQVFDVISTRDHTWHEAPFDLDLLREFYTSEMPYSREKHGREIIGLFEGDVLDAFILTAYPEELSIMATDPRKKEKSAHINTFWSRKGPTRVKNASGFDVNMTKLINEGLLNHYVDNGYYTHWLCVPLTFRPWLENKEHWDVHRHKYQTLDTLIPAGTLSEGYPHSDFIRKYLCPAPHRVTMNARVVTMKPEYREIV